MSLLNRITATFVATVDKTVTRLEDHDAVVESSIRETRSAAARARVKLARVRKDGENLIAKRENLQTALETWTQRARDTADQDEAKALQCLQRRKHCQKQLEQIEETLKRHKEVDLQISANLQSIETRLQEITQQRNQMRSRQTTAEALRVVNSIDTGGDNNLNDTFDRWETSIVEVEAVGGGELSADYLEQEFAQQETDDALREELASLLNKSEKPA